MNLKDFENNISPEILKRGYSYFNNHHVISLEEEEPGIWFAEVAGNEDYNVNIEIDKNEINYWDCDCPFEGEICKHVTAVLYALKENESPQIDSHKKKKSKKSKTKSIEQIFNKVSKEEIIEFIKSQFSKDRNFKSAFIAYFAELIDEDTENKYKIIVKNIIKASGDRHGFIDYRSAGTLTNNLHQLLNKSDMLLEKGNIIESLGICKAAIEEAPSLVQNMDDSDGGINEILDHAFDIFYQVAEKAPPELKDVLFQYCIENYSKSNYHEFDFGDGFLNTLPGLITTEEQEKQFIIMIDNLIDSERDNTFSNYRVTHLLQVKIDYFTSRDRKDEAWKLIEDNKQYPEFREKIVEGFLNKKDYIKTIELCFEGIKIAEEKEHPGTVHNWNEKLLSIYETTKNIIEIRKMAKKLFLENHFSMRYYKKLKSTYQKTEWTEICEGIIDNIKGKEAMGGYHDATVLADIFVEENYRERLLKLLQLNSEEINFIDKYSKHLRKQFPNELVALYGNGIKKLAENTGRRYYNEVVHYLKRLKEIDGGDEKVNSLVNQFSQIYKNRKAMMQVLNIEIGK